MTLFNKNRTFFLFIKLVQVIRKVQKIMLIFIFNRILIDLGMPKPNYVLSDYLKQELYKLLSIQIGGVNGEISCRVQ